MLIQSHLNLFRFPSLLRLGFIVIVFPFIYQHSKTVLVYCSPKYNTMAMALSTASPKATIQFHPLVDIMTANMMMPDTHSVWLDLPTRGLPNRGPFLKSISALISQCKQANIPFTLITSKDDRIDGTTINKLPHGTEPIPKPLIP